jgi:hypothetical protein
MANYSSPTTVPGGNQPRPPEEYFIEAIEAVRTNRRNYQRGKVVKMGEALKVGFCTD